MKRARRLFAGTVLTIVLACAPPTIPVFAARAAQNSPDQNSQQAPQADHKTEKAPDPLQTPAGESMRWLNFGIVVVVFVYFIAKKGGPAFRARAAKISAGITSAAAVKAQADADLRKAEAGLAKLDQDSAAMRAESQKEFAAETERIRAAGKLEISRIESAATAEIDAARRVAQRDLRALAAQLAAARAAEILPGQITDVQRAALVRRFVDELPTPGARGLN
jgi:F0F1-type ATP synthase membrane subunit b/b'